VTQGTFFRAATAYRRQLAHELGRLVHQAAVVAGMRVRDHNTYVPDPRVVPKDVGRMRTQLRELWHESRPLVRDAAWFMEDTDQQALQDFEDDIAWDDPLPLSRLAVGLRPRDPLARISLGVAWLRQGNGFIGENQLHIGLNWVEKVPGTKTRILRNMAFAYEEKGDFQKALALMKQAKEEAPEDLCSTLGFLGMSVASGDKKALTEAVLWVKEKEEEEPGGLASCVFFLNRRNTRPAREMATHPWITFFLERELNLVGEN